MATAMLVVGETGLPALLGILVFHDRTRPGFVPVAVIGFLCAVGGAVALSRFGEAETARPAGADGPDQDAAASSTTS